MQVHKLLGLLVLVSLLVGPWLATDPGVAAAQPPDGQAGLGQGNGVDAAWPGPDPFGYIGQTVPYNWVDIRTSGTPILGLHDDDAVGPLPIGFAFDFYGTTWTEFYAGSNGLLSFGAGVGRPNNECPLNSSVSPNNLIAILWDDLDFGDGGYAYYQTFYACPVGAGQCLVVEYYNATFINDPPGSAGTWEAILFESGSIRLQYLDAGDELGRYSTTGIEGGDLAEADGLTYACNTAASLSDGLAIEFLLPLLRPAAAAKSGCAGSDVTYSLTLANRSGTDLTYDLAYTATWPISGPLSLFVANGAAASFDVSVEVPCGGESDAATVTASGGGDVISSTLTTAATVSGLQSWEGIAPMNSLGRNRPAVAAVGGKVYLIGGHTTDGAYLDTVEEFDPVTGAWTTRAALTPEPSSDSCAAAIGTDIYVVGGESDSYYYMDRVQVYDTVSDAWTTVTSDPLPVPTLGMGCAALGGELYVYGGETYDWGDILLDTAYVYDPASPAGSRWTALPHMVHARVLLAGAPVGGKVYAVGGADKDANDMAYVEAFDPADGQWHVVTDMTTARAGPGAYVRGNDLIVCGGGYYGHLDTCESYDTTQGYAGAWTTLAQTMVTGRRTFGYASLPAGLYAVGGHQSGGSLASVERLPILTCKPCGLEHEVFLPLVVK